MLNPRVNVRASQSFMFIGGKRAVLLLHGFTGTTADVRMLGRFLQKHGYTCHAPLYKGHGVPPEELMNTGPADWWKSVEEGYRYLVDKGYDEIAVVGLSLGGVFSLKVGYTFKVKGVVSMCAPMCPGTEGALYKNILSYAKEYKRFEQKSPEQIQAEMKLLKVTPKEGSKAFVQLVQDVKEQLEYINCPVFVVQARLDEIIDVRSADVIYELVGVDQKSLKWYEDSTHVITLGTEKKQLYDDVYRFLERLEWGI